MSFTYDPKQLAESPLFQVRLQIGDTVESNPIFQDEEINYYLGKNDNDVLLTSKECVELILSKIAREIDYKLGPYSESHQRNYDMYSKLLKQIEDDLNGSEIPASKKPTTAPIFSYDMMSLSKLKDFEDEP